MGAPGGSRCSCAAINGLSFGPEDYRETEANDIYQAVIVICLYIYFYLLSLDLDPKTNPIFNPTAVNL